MAKRWIFTYLFCNDLQKMIWFYKDVLHLDPIWEDEKSAAFKIGDHQLSITLNQDSTPLSANYAIQPGWKGGTEPRTSWSLECEKVDFNEILQSIKSAQVLTFFSEPEWKGYWSFPILDPMNNTIEVTCTEKDI